jgi:glycosyltransferase involved in cell wall biosynthesis
MKSSLYSIVLPTRGRADTLRHTLKTVLDVEGTDYEVIVAGNGGGPETRQVVEAFASEKIRYVHSSEPLSMADNWERGLEAAAGDYITFLGDDDGMMPDALELARRFHGERPRDILSWVPFTWVWPQAPAAELRNFAALHFGSHIENRNSRAALKDILSHKTDWTTLPTIYCSFVPRPEIETIRAAHGRYFLASLPDVFSGIANLISSTPIFYCYRPLTCWGLSHHSTGMAQMYQAGPNRDQLDEDRRRAAPDPWHPRVRGAELIVEVRIFDLYLKMKDKLFPDDEALKPDMAGLLRHVAGVSARRFHERWHEVKAAVEEMARVNGLDAANFPVAPPGSPPVTPFGYYRAPGVAGEVVRFWQFTDPRTVRTIEDFVSYAHRLCVPPSRVDMAEEAVWGGRLRKLVGRVSRHIRRRLREPAAATAQIGAGPSRAA